MESIAAIDQMTGFYNRNGYMTIAQKMMDGSKMPLLILLGDVNNLKTVNDTLGHLCGDKLLHRIAEIIRETAPCDAFIARIGGDEMVLLVPNASEDIAETFVQEIHARTEAVKDEGFGKLSISWGWALIRSLDEDYNEAFKRADEQMYQKKKLYKQQNVLTLSGALPLQTTDINENEES
jgi:diguanylate cyclase (GGDEF)-like protein